MSLTWTRRKRRRQNYMCKRQAFKAVDGDQKDGKKPRKERPTLDGGIFDQAPPTARRSITIYDKLTVIKYYEQLEKEENEARDTMAEPKNVKASREERKALKVAKKAAKERLKRNKQHACKKAYPDIVGKCAVWKWIKTAKYECWAQLPEPVQRKLKATPNSWRKKCGCKTKGRQAGDSSSVPAEIQKELDFLVLDHAVGRSDVSERREAITTDNVAPWLVR